MTQFNIYDSSETLMVKYYFALEQKLPLVHETTFSQIEDEIQHSMRGISLQVKEDIFPMLTNPDDPKKFYSLGIYQMDSNGLGKWESGVRAIHQALALQENKKAKKLLNEYEEKFSSPQTTTVVSVATIIEPGTESFNEDNLPMSLIESIDFLDRFVKSLSIVLHYPHQVNYRTIHSGVVRTSQTLDGQIIDQKFILLPHAKDTYKSREATVEENGIIAATFLRYRSKDPTLRYLDYRNSGNNDLNNGLYSSACLKLGIASEVILSAVLSLSLWEDSIAGNISDEEAAAILASPLASRVRSQYSSRFGGNWHSILDEWDVKVAQPRNRVVHSGADLSKEIASDSLLTVKKLQKFIADTLAAKNIAKFTRTTWIMVGHEGLRTRNVLKSATKNKDKISNSNTTGIEETVAWLEQYNSWMNNLQPKIAEKMRDKKPKSNK